MSSIVETLNFTKICRVCCVEGAMMSVFKVNIHKKIMACTSIQVWQNDGLPGQICNKCVAKLHISFQFKKQCERSDIRLRLCKESGQYIESKVCEGTHVSNISDNDIIHRNIVKEQADHSVVSNMLPSSNYGYPACASSLSETRHYDTIETMDVATHDIHVEPQLIYNGNSILTSMTNVNLPIQGQIQLCGNYNIQTNGNNPAFQNTFSIHGQIQPQTLPTQMVTLDTAGGEHRPLLRSHDQTFNRPEADSNAIPDDRNDVKPDTAIKKKRIPIIHNRKEKIVCDHDAYRCPLCNKVFGSNGKLTRHMKTHSADLPYKCKVCPKAFSHSGNLKVHMRMHTDERPFACRLCHKTCRQQQDLDKHVRTHTGERPHSCATCHRAFATSSNLIAHERIHSGEKPYVCSVCQKGFCQSNELTKHMRTHTGEKSHICRVCDKGFNGSSRLIVHMRIHTGERPFLCTICNKAFTQSSCLATHTRRHAGARGFVCQRCPRSFATVQELRVHVATHAPAIHACSVSGCQRRFSRPSDLIRHVRNLHAGARPTLC